jgi:hypothetical protein
VFIAYVEEDLEWAEKIAAGLEKEGYSTWYYTRDNIAGRKFTVQIMEALAVVEVMVVVLSVPSLQSDHIGNELDEAGNNRKPIIALLNSVSYELFKRRRPGWAYWIGTNVALAIPPLRCDKIIEGLKANGIHSKKPVDSGARLEAAPAVPPMSTEEPDASAGADASGVVQPKKKGLPAVCHTARTCLGDRRCGVAGQKLAALSARQMLGVAAR